MIQGNFAGARVQGAQPFKTSGYRWLILLLFLPMPLSQVIGVPGATDATVLCGCGWFVGVAAILGSMKGSLRSELWVWAVMFVFLMGYYVKYFAFAYGMGTPVFDLLMIELSWADLVQLNNALIASTIGFIAFAVTACFLLRADSVPALAAPPSARCINQKVLLAFIGLTLAGVLVSLAAALVFGFGQMGLEHHELPLHLDAVFTRFRVTLAPAIFITALWVSDRRETRKVWFATLAAMIVSAALDAYVRGSRGSIAIAFLPLIFIWLLSGKYSAGRKALTAVIVLVTVALFPLFTSVRQERIASGQGLEYDAQAASAQSSSSEGVALSLNEIAGRVVGIDSMIEVINHVHTPPGADQNLTTINPSRLLWLANGGQMVTYMTYTVVGISEDAVEGRSPGLLGGLYLVGGLDGMILLTICYALFLWLAWKRTSRHPYATPLLAFLASVILSYTQEGVYGLENPISTVLAMVIVIWIFRRFIVLHPSHHGDRQTYDQSQKRAQ